MILRAAHLCVCVATASGVHAGAWPRAEGGGFLSVSQEIHRRKDGTLTGYLSVYAEYGQTERLTFGLEGGGNDTGTFSDVTLFARVPFGPTDGADRFAVQFGVGLREKPGGGGEAVVKPALAWGRGFDSRFGPGWMGLDASTTLGLDTSDTWSKLDLTLGLSPDADSHLIVQLQTYHDRFGSIVKLAPSYVRRLRGNLKIEIGVIQPLNTGQSTGLKAGTWFEW
jgi:hypothetical protein